MTIASKFVLRVRGKHVFNPTNFGIVAMMLATGGRSGSRPGQWGSAAFFAFLLACLGGLVVNRAARSDVTYAFLGFYLAVLFGRALWLGQPAAIPLHQLESGALPDLHLLHDLGPAGPPPTRGPAASSSPCWSPSAPAASTSCSTGPTGCSCRSSSSSPAVPLIDRLLPGGRYAWRRVQTGPGTALSSRRRFA